MPTPPLPKQRLDLKLKGGDLCEDEKLPEDVERLLRQLVCNGSIQMARMALKLYACRCLNMDGKAANAFVLRYFKEVYPKELECYRNKKSDDRNNPLITGGLFFICP